MQYIKKYNNKKYSQSAIMMHVCDICKKKKKLSVKTIRSPKPYILDPVLSLNDGCVYEEVSFSQFPHVLNGNANI